MLLVKDLCYFKSVFVFVHFFILSFSFSNKLYVKLKNLLGY